VLAPFLAAGVGVELLAARATGRPPDSYGLIPQVFFASGSLVFGLIAYWAMRACCRRVAGEHVARLAALASIFATPAAFYIFLNPTMAHASSLGLVSLMLVLWWSQWEHGVSYAKLVLLGLITGIAAAVRYQNVLFGLLPVVLVLRESARSSVPRTLPVATAGLIAFLVPLLLQATLGSTHGSTGGGLSWQPGGILQIGQVPLHVTSPFFRDVLFSCKHGAFHWAPVMALAGLGLVWAAVRSAWARVFLLVVAANVYLIGGLGLVQPGGTEIAANPGATTWENLWPGGTMFGMRYLVECVPLLAVGLAALIDRTSVRLSVLWLWRMLLGVLVVWNALLMMSYGLGTVSRSGCVTYPEMLRGMTRAFGQARELLR